MAANSNSLWMGDLANYMDEIFISSAFAAMGVTVKKVKLMLHKLQGTNAGYCFVEFEDAATADNAMKRLNGLPVPGTNPIKRFKLNYAVHSLQNQGPEYSLYVGDLTPNVTDYMMLTFFQSRYQSVKAAKVVSDTNGKSKRFGFVRFHDEADQKRALYEMQGAMGLGGKPIKVNQAVQKGLGRAATNSSQYYQQYQQQYQQYLQSYYQQANAYQQQPLTLDQYYQQQYQQNYQTADADDQEPEDPNPELDIAGSNRMIMETEKKLYFELEEARWNPIETYATTIPTETVLT